MYTQRLHVDTLNKLFRKILIHTGGWVIFLLLPIVFSMGRAIRFDKITYQDVLERRLKVMDTSAISLCMDNNLPIVVFNMNTPGNILKAATGDLSIGTLVSMDEKSQMAG